MEKSCPWAVPILDSSERRFRREKIGPFEHVKVRFWLTNGVEAQSNYNTDMSPVDQGMSSDAGTSGQFVFLCMQC